MATTKTHLTKKDILAHPAPPRGFDILRDLREPSLAVRVDASGSRSYVVLNRKRYKTAAGRVTTKSDNMTIAKVADLGLEHARAIANTASALYLDNGGDKDAVRREIARKQKGVSALVIAAPKNSGVTVAAVVDQMFQVNVNRADKPWKPETARSYRTHWNSHILANIPTGLLLEDFTDDYVKPIIAECPTAATQKLVVSCLRALEAFCEDDAPVCFTRPSARRCQAPAPQKRAAAGHRTLHEVRAVGRYCHQQLSPNSTLPIRYRRMAQMNLCSMYAFPRLHTLMEFTPEMIVEGVDDKPAYLHFPAETMKGSKPDDFTQPVSDGLARVLRDLKPGKDGRFFRRNDENSMWNFRNLILAPALGFKLTNHAWRHTFSTHAKMLGLNPVEVELALSHKLGGVLGNNAADAYNGALLWRTTRDCVNTYGDFLDFVIHTDADLGNGTVTPKVEAAFHKWRDGGKVMMRAA